MQSGDIIVDKSSELLNDKECYDYLFESFTETMADENIAKAILDVFYELLNMFCATFPQHNHKVFIIEVTMGDLDVTFHTAQSGYCAPAVILEEPSDIRFYSPYISCEYVELEGNEGYLVYPLDLSKYNQ